MNQTDFADVADGTQLRIVRPDDLTPYTAGSAKAGNENQYEMKDFFGGSRDGLAGPQVFLVDLKTPHGVINPHFHPEDQFQVITRGTGLLGKTPVKPATMHYVDGYKAYGPITAEADGIAFFTIRMRATRETHFMPESRKLMQHRSSRPQLVFDFTEKPAGFVHGPCEDGLAVEKRVESRGAAIALSAPTDSGGQIVLVVEGTLERGNEEYRRWSCAHVEKGQHYDDLRAGSLGVELMILQFPVQPVASEVIRTADKSA